MMRKLRIALGQVNCVVGDVSGNADRVVAAADRARVRRADLLLLPELVLSGYPPEDLLFHRGFRHHIADAMARLPRALDGLDVVLGYPEYEGQAIHNSAAVLRGGRLLANYRKQQLPNYQVFDEKRYFEPGRKPACFEVGGVRAALLICEDMWTAGPAAQARAADASLALVLNASPFEQRKQARREQVLQARARETGMTFVYVNLVGGQDELVFDGRSMVVGPDGALLHREAPFVETVSVVECEVRDGRPAAWRGTVSPAPVEEETAYGAIVTGIRDYVGKHGFPGVVIGLSGGIDSALVLAMAVDALGADRVQAVAMPSRYTLPMSMEDAAQMAAGLGVRYSVVSIEPMFKATLESLVAEFAGRPADTTEENIQARCRGMLLMGISNKSGRLVLTTGNKSEMSVGYATLYGDMAGGFAPIKDCSKLLVYRLARWRNGPGRVIPQRIIERPPSAELRANQQDSDSLPPYEVLDPILEDFIERDLTVQEIVERGHDRETVVRVLEMVRRAEYKRRQAPPGVRISTRAFGRDWRYPITSGYRPGGH